MTNSGVEHLGRVIRTRAKRRGLRADLTRFRYANGCLYSGFPGARAGRVLYMGVGHGLDALLALYDGLADSVVGVDPYISEHGNDDEDYENLLEMIEELGFADRFALERKTGQEYLASSSESFDAIVFTDVLHHIFCTEKRLTRSPEFQDAAALFKSLRDAGGMDAHLVIGEPGRHGLRQFLVRWGLVKTAVNYRTKQSWREWDAAARAGGWVKTGLRNYVPYALRHLAALLGGAIGRSTVCDKYFLYYGKR